MISLGFFRFFCFFFVPGVCRLFRSAVNAALLYRWNLVIKSINHDTSCILFEKNLQVWWYIYVTCNIIYKVLNLKPWTRGSFLNFFLSNRFLVKFFSGFCGTRERPACAVQSMWEHGGGGAYGRYHLSSYRWELVGRDLRGVRVDPALGLLSVWSFTCSPRVRVGFLQVLSGFLPWR